MAPTMATVRHVHSFIVLLLTSLSDNGLMQQSVGFHQAPNPGAGITTRIINIALVALHDSNHELNRYTLQPTLVHEYVIEYSVM